MATAQCECIVEVEHIRSQFKYDDIVDSAQHRVWSDAADVFRSVTVDFGTGPVVIEGDWGPVIRKLAAGGMSMEDADKYKLQHGRWPDIPKQDVESIKLTLTAVQEPRTTVVHYVEIYLSQVFLAINLAMPGAADFSSFRIRNSEATGAHVKWPSDLFDGSWIYGTQWPWALPSEVSLAETWHWLQRLRPMGSQVAHSAVQRALFCLLHASLAPHLSPTILIWLCSALETLYDVPDTTIGRTLRNRVFQLLGRPTNHTVAARQITNLYDLRSKFAHGSFEVVHPVQNELLDSHVLRIHDALDPILSFGHALVVSTLQHMIRNGWRALRFDETLRGEPATPGTLGV
jgi:hypothetical protein